MMTTRNPAPDRNWWRRFVAVLRSPWPRLVAVLALLGGRGWLAVTHGGAGVEMARHPA
jgi:hypothetical protein